MILYLCFSLPAALLGIYGKILLDFFFHYDYYYFRMICSLYLQTRFAEDECQIKQLPFIIRMATHKEQIEWMNNDIKQNMYSQTNIIATIIYLLAFIFF